MRTQPFSFNDVLEERLLEQKYKYELKILKAKRNAFLLGLFVGAIVSIVYIFTK